MRRLRLIPDVSRLNPRLRRIGMEASKSRHARDRLSSANLPKAEGSCRTDRYCPKSTLRLAMQIDKILRGANPGDLPVERPTRFELVINLREAKALGVSIPRLVRLRADELIQ